MRYLAAFSFGQNNGSVIYPKVLAHSMTVKEVLDGLEKFTDEDMLAAFNGGKAAAIKEIVDKEGAIQFVPGSFTQKGAQAAYTESPTVGQLKEKLKPLPGDTRVIWRYEGIAAPVYGLSKVGPGGQRVP